MEIDQLGTEVEYCTKSSLIVNKESRTRKLVVHISHNQAALAIFTILSSKIWSFPLRPWQQNLLVVVFDRLVSRQVLEYFRGRKLDEKLLNKLKVKLRSIDALADDAEQKQFRDPRVREWLVAVKDADIPINRMNATKKDAMFDAEDLLDEIDYEINKWDVENDSESQTCTCKESSFFETSFSSFNMKIESRMKQVLSDLEFLSSQKGDLGLKEASGLGVGSGSKVSQILPSISLVTETTILNWLTSDTDNHNKLSILSIVGMGGMGKTTLAQHVYNNPRIQEAKFDIKVWVCVSDDFDVLMLSKTILNKITKSKDDSGDDLEMVHGRLKEKLSGKKYLLVLDDVWNEDRDQWKALQTPLKYGAKGSKILVTTRSNKVASIMQSNKVHELKKLQEDHSWQVFAQHAFQDDCPKLNAELKEIGIKIVKKCQGLPLALETVGCLLHKKPSVSQWEGVLKSKMWELPIEDSKIIPALLLSYYHLPSHLKRCFAYCALFPKDHRFYMEGLIQLWVAENFVQCSTQSNPQEEIGEQYFNDLLSRSFFQRSSREKCFVMHDLLNDLAKYVLFDKLDSHQVLDYFLGRKLDGRLLKKLKRKLVSVNAVVDDAEQKQFTDAYVKAWLDDVRDVLLDTEDLLDEIDCEFSKTELEAESQTSASKVCDFESRIIDVLDDLDSLLDQKNDLGLKNVTDVGVGSGSGSKVSQKLPSTSLVVESIIYGRDDDKEIILNWLTSDTDNHNKISILSIVGMGGMGKTTLAQHVYNNPRIQEVKFDIKVWVCVSDDFDVLMLTKTILNKITKSKEDSGDDLEMVHGRLKEKLSGNKYLLVLDDVWNEDRDQWKALQTPLKYGAKGSKILVTTRSNKVASIMQSNKVHELKQLQEDHSWQVFAQHAFQDDYPKLNEQLKEIGIKIVEKCQGLPLALETVGCLLHTKPSVSQWEGVLKSKIWELPKEDSKIIPALLLSYYHLPSHLKRCFAYCALFPKDHEFYKDSLIQLWVAENFVQCSQESTPQEEIGEQYFNDLLSRSFFQRSSREKCFVMHDLLNDLAKYVCGDICFRLGVDKTKSISKVRHFSFVPEYHQYFDGYGSLYHAKRLRTFMPTLPGRDMYIWGGRKLVDELCSKFKFLRILSLFRCDLIEMPDSVGNLKHLRSLDLSKTYIKKLPDSICFLCNLQVLKLNSCDHLEELPSNLHKLTNLRCLEFMYTKVRKMPMHFGKLKNLQVLSSFYVGMGSDNCSIQQLGELNLHGRLSIEELQNIVNPLDALAADLKNKTHLLDLELKWNEHQNLDDSIKERQVLENLQPSRHLEKLSIGNYGGTQFPSWLLDNSLCNVVWLSLKNCKYCLCLPPLGLLPLLKELLIGGLDGIVSINADFYGSSSCSFTSLESLEFYDMKEWEEWECMTGAFPRLQRLYIEDCPKLKGHLPEQLCQLNDLKISGCEQLVPSALSAPDIHQLFLGDCGKLQIDHPTTLKVLTIEGYNVEAALLEQIGHNYACSNKNIPMHSCYDFLVKLEIIGGCDSLTTIHLDIFPILGVLYIRKCPNLQRISQGHAHNHLENLSIIECPQLESLPEGMHVLLPSLDSLWIIHCPKVQMFPEGGLPSNLKNMRLYGSSKLISLLKSALGDNHSLERLSIGKVDVECLPDEGVLPHSLVTLDISRCEDLKRLDYKGLCHLSSLKKLHLSNCPRLQCLPEEGLPKSISTLSIYNCPLLKQRCREPKGEDWPKIAHIKRVSAG
ncbi:putative disease resistance RPP13-like protein 1 [Glycine max]|nr:putative disease resistance RPP13-like protein 1 [Glycine max]